MHGTFKFASGPPYYDHVLIFNLLNDRRNVFNNIFRRLNLPSVTLIINHSETAIMFHLSAICAFVQCHFGE